MLLCILNRLQFSIILQKLFLLLGAFSCYLHVFGRDPFFPKSVCAICRFFVNCMTNVFLEDEKQNALFQKVIKSATCKLTWVGDMK